MSQSRWLACALVLLTGASTARVVTASPALGAQSRRGPVQPVPYSHKQHLAMGLQCQMCHTNPDAGRLMTYPPAATCMGCHAGVAADRPSIQTLATLAAAPTPIPWVRVYRIGDNIIWKHANHITKDVGTCADCHGPVAERDVIAVETDVTSMDGCIACHTERQVSNKCAVCHAGSPGA